MRVYLKFGGGGRASGMLRGVGHVWLGEGALG